MDERLDKFLVKKGYFDSRNRAQQEIKEGNIKVESKVCRKKSFSVNEESNIEIIKRTFKYVSRSGVKLKKFLKNINLNLIDFKVLDIGSSTGGFVEVLLEQGANNVYAVDVGTDQLHPKLKSSDKVLSKENTDIRDFLKRNKNIHFDLITADLSFISLKKIVEQLIKRADKYIFLFKPQFETPKRFKNKKGVIKNPDIHIKYLKKFVDFLEEIGFNILQIKKSEVKGSSGNQEYFLYCDNSKSESITMEYIKKEVLSR